MSEAGDPAAVSIEPARAPEEMETVRALFLEYQRWLGVDLCFQGFEQELADLPGAYGPPRGGLWLARGAGGIAACVGLRPLDRDRAEMKRLWVRPAFRGQGLGRRPRSRARSLEPRPRDPGGRRRNPECRYWTSM